MAAITSNTESWNNHTFSEVETHIKTRLDEAGEKKYDDVTPGIYVFYSDGSLKTSGTARSDGSIYAGIGVAVITSNTKFVLQRMLIHRNQTYLVPSRYISLITQSSLPTYTSDSDAFLDFNGYKNTYTMNKLAEICGNQPYGNRNMLFGQMHVPSLGQALAIQSNCTEIKDLLKYMGESASNVDQTGLKMATSTVYVANPEYGRDYYGTCIPYYVDDGSGYGRISDQLPIWGVITLDYDYDNLEPL